MRNIPELLAPASGWPQLKAAINNGADAVYIGGALFNARMKADNFRGDDIKAAIDYAHERAVKVYVTLNTLIKDSELAKAFAYANELYGYGADGLIIQDMGLGRLLHKYLPDMPLHLSTQGTAYNEWAADLVKEMGYCRIVPARELSLDEIRAMAGRCHELGMSMEVFCHGALCMCYSGQCQMSRMLGAGKDMARNGRSGNRGLCAQPCRLMYGDDSGCKTYALSPKDLCLIEEIPALCEAGVDSLKIEGRLKSPEYVAVVTGIYRKYLDIYASMDEDSVVKDFKVDPEDMKRLKQIFNRGDFTKGYLYGNPGDDILSGTSPKNSGLYAGRVVAIRDVKGKGAKAEGRQLIDIDTRGAECGEIAIGDGIELPMTGNMVTYVEKLPGGILRVGDLKGVVMIGDEVRKVTDGNQLKSARATIEGDEICEAAKTVVDMRFTATTGKEPVLEIVPAGNTSSMKKETITVKGDAALEKALNRPSDSERIEGQLRKLGGTPLIAGSVDVGLYGDPMVPISIVNGLRREAVEVLMADRREVSRKCLSEAEINDIMNSETIAANEKAGFDGKRLVPLEWFMDEANRGSYRGGTIPYIINVSKGNLDRFIEDHFDEIVDAVRDCGIAIGNLGWIKQFTDRGIKVYGDYGLNVFNMQAEKAFAEAGVEMIALSDEMSKDGKHVIIGNAGAKSFSREPEIMERVPLMIMEHPLNTEYLMDRKGVKHKTLKWYSGDKYLVF